MLGAQVLTKGNRGVLLLALFFGLVSAALIYIYLKANAGEEGGRQISGATQPVVVAAQDIAAGETIAAEMVKVELIPSSLMVGGALTETAAVVGKVALYPIASGEQVLRSDFATGILENPALAETVPEGMRGVSVQVGEITAAGGLIRPGDRVDVILAFQDASALTILQDVEVLAIAQNVEPRVATSEEEAGPERQVVSEGEAQADALSATLAVTPQQAQALVAAEEYSQGGELKLSESQRAALDLSVAGEEEGEGEESITCQGSLRLVVRSKFETGSTTLTSRGLCAAAFLLVWGGYGLE